MREECLKAMFEIWPLRYCLGANKNDSPQRLRRNEGRDMASLKSDHSYQRRRARWDDVYSWGWNPIKEFSQSLSANLFIPSILSLSCKAINVADIFQLQSAYIDLNRRTWPLGVDVRGTAVMQDESGIRPKSPKLVNM